MKPSSIRFFGSHDPEQVVLHLLRAGYAALASGGDDNSNLQSHIRTVYFKHPDAFPEIDAFTLETPSLYPLDMEVVRLEFKAGIDALHKEKPIRAIVLGTRMGDPNTVRCSYLINVLMKISHQWMYPICNQAGSYQNFQGQHEIK
jgi:hypothetical protein